MSALVSEADRKALAADATGRVSLLAFLLYRKSLHESSLRTPLFCEHTDPGSLLLAGLTTKIFDAFLCRVLGPDHSILAVEYSVDCVGCLTTPR